MTDTCSKCLLCDETDTVLYHTDKRREFFKCKCCDLVFVPKKLHLSIESEKKRYLKHQNNPDDSGYIKFLTDFYKQVLSYIPHQGKGLDFGSGPNPQLSKIFIDNGFKMDIYDPHFSNNISVFKKRYDFIVICEVIEHLRTPLKDLEILWHNLKSAGNICIRTALLYPAINFSKWYYKNDNTHIAFYSRSTFNWLAHTLQAEVMIDNNLIKLLKK